MKGLRTAGAGVGAGAVVAGAGLGDGARGEAISRFDLGGSDFCVDGIATDLSGS